MSNYWTDGLGKVVEFIDHRPTEYRAKAKPSDIEIVGKCGSPEKVRLEIVEHINQQR